MALKATIYKAELSISDIGRHYYDTHGLTIARHPSETQERMMLRLAAFAWHASPELSFCKGLSDAGEPDLWAKDAAGTIRLWVEVGLPDERRLLQACGRAESVTVYAYGPTVGVWWKQIASRLERARNLTVFQLSPESTQALGAAAERSMRWQVTIDDHHLWLSSAEVAVALERNMLKGPSEEIHRR